MKGNFIDLLKYINDAFESKNSETDVFEKGFLLLLTFLFLHKVTHLALLKNWNLGFTVTSAQNIIFLFRAKSNPIQGMISPLHLIEKVNL